MTKHVLTQAAVSLLVAVALCGTPVAAQQGPPPPEFLTTGAVQPVLRCDGGRSLASN